MRVFAYQGKEPTVKQQDKLDTAAVLDVISRQLSLLETIAETVVLIERGTAITAVSGDEPKKRESHD